MLKPHENLRCLFIHTAFSKQSYWNYKIACELVNAKAPSAPLGLITVAALLPQNWDMRLMDLNAQEFSQEDWDWAQVVCIGGMLPQQEQMLKYIRKGTSEGKLVVCGGADPSSQPELYREATARVLGEAELTIPMWIEQWQRSGNPEGIFETEEKPDVTTSPIPRYDLLKLNDYLQVGVQYSRGCPFNCEFCDIIELFGRKPRTKNPEQILAELQVLYDLGYRGSIEFVDDNFIGNKRFVKRDLLPKVIAWQQKNRYPFYFSTEASMNLADDRKLLRQMRAAGFRFVFMGIETPDPSVLLQTQKSQNTVGDIGKRINTIYEYGIVVLGGFIVGFDGEQPGIDLAMIRLIEESSVCAAMVGLLVALPNTQLTRRLRRENRLFSFQGELLGDGEGDQKIGGNVDDAFAKVIDQTTAGLNFVTKRDRLEILEEYSNVIRHIYAPDNFANRVISLVEKSQFRPHRKPTLKEAFVETRGFFRMIGHYLRRPTSRAAFFRVLFNCAKYGSFRLEIGMRMMAMYLHFEDQTNYILESVKGQMQASSLLQRQTLRASIEQEIKQAAALSPSSGELPFLVI